MAEPRHITDTELGSGVDRLLPHGVRLSAVVGAEPVLPSALGPLGTPVPPGGREMHSTTRAF